MTKTTMFDNGVTNAAPNSFERLSNFPFPDLSRWHEYFEDFDYYQATDWVVTEVGVATQALADEDGGVLLITNAAADNDSSFSQKAGESFLLSTAKNAWFKGRVKVSDATQSDMILGLAVTDTTPLDATDGIYFQKLDDGTGIDLVIVKSGTATTLLDVADMVDDTYIELAFHYDASRARLSVYVDDVLATESIELDNFPDDEVLTVTYGVQNGEAVAKTMSVDYLSVLAER